VGGKEVKIKERTLADRRKGNLEKNEHSAGEARGQRLAVVGQEEKKDVLGKEASEEKN